MRTPRCSVGGESFGPLGVRSEVSRWCPSVLCRTCVAGAPRCFVGGEFSGPSVFGRRFVVRAGPSACCPRRPADRNVGGIICVECIGTVPGAYLDPTCCVPGAYQDRTWSVRGPSLDRTWSVPGPCLDRICTVLGPGTWTGPGLYLDHTWSVPGAYVGVHSLTADDRGPVLEVRRPFYLRRRDRVNSRDVLLGVLFPPLQLPLLVGQVLAAALGGARRQLRLGGCLWLCIALCPSWKRRKVEKDEKKKEEVREGVGKGRERWSV